MAAGARVRKAVIAAAGYGTRMLPITRTVSKEILPLVDKPIIQLVVEELVDAGVEDIIIVVASHKTDLVDYFSEANPTLMAHLRQAGPSKAALVQELESIQELANIAFVEQRKHPYGTGVPILDAAPYLGGEPFIYTYADDFFLSANSSGAQLIETYQQYGTPVFGCMRRTGDEDYKRYGYVDGQEIGLGLVELRRYVEKPGKEHAPSDLAAFGYYLLTPEVVRHLERLLPEVQPGKEFFMIDAFNAIIAEGGQVLAKELSDGEYFDTGNKLEYMKTAVAMAARHPEIGEDFKRFLTEFNKQ